MKDLSREYLHYSFQLTLGICLNGQTGKSTPVSNLILYKSTDNNFYHFSNCILVVFDLHFYFVSIDEKQFRPHLCYYVSLVDLQVVLIDFPYTLRCQIDPPAY